MHILVREGIHEQDAQKMVKYLEIDDNIELGRLDQVFNRAKTMLLSKSGAYKLFEAALVQHAKLIIERLEVQDYNRDGMLNIDGFRGSCRMSEVGLSDRELGEVFYLICGAD